MPNSPEDPLAPARNMKQFLHLALQHIQEDSTQAADKILKIRVGRRTAAGLTIGAGTTATLLTALGIYALAHPEVLGLIAHHPNAEVISGAQELLHIIDNQPSENQLREHIVNINKKISLEDIRQQLIANTHGAKSTLHVQVHGLGDSYMYTDGMKNDGTNGIPDPKNQPNSLLQIAEDMIAPFLDDIGIASWETYTQAVPGAPSGDGYPGGTRQYGLLGPEQFSDETFQAQLRRGLDPNNKSERDDEENVLHIVAISATGDDWRMLMVNALAFANFFSELQHVENATQADLDKFKALFAKSNEIAVQYEQHIASCLQKIEEVNVLRRQKGLLDVQVALAHPISLLQTSHVPFSTLNNNDSIKGLESVLIKVKPDDSSDHRYYLDLEKIPYGKKIAYLITVAMYQKLAEAMSGSILEDPLFGVYPMQWMGLEQIPNFFSTDGHPDATGTLMQAALFLNLLEAFSTRQGTLASLDKVATVSPQISQVVSDITHTSRT